MSTPTTSNGLANDINTIVKDGESAGIAIVESMIIADQPWLGLPGVKQIWEALFGWIMSYVTSAAETGIDFAVIDVQVDGEETNISKALAAVQAAYKSGDKNALAQALADYRSAQSALANDDGSSTAQ